MKYQALLGVFFLALLLVGCPSAPVVPHVHQPTDTADCSAACHHLQDLKCPEGDTVPGGWCEDGSMPTNGKCASGQPAGDLTCEKFCKQTQDQGHALNPSCVKTIQQCDQVETVCAR